MEALCSLLGAPLNRPGPQTPSRTIMPLVGRDRVEGDFSTGIVAFSYKDSGSRFQLLLCVRSPLHVLGDPHLGA